MPVNHYKSKKMKSITIAVFVFAIMLVILSFKSTNAIAPRLEKEYLYIEGMQYLVIHSEGNFQVVNVTKDLSEIKYYKKK